MNPFDPEYSWKLVLFGVISFIGGFLGYVMRTLDAGKKVAIVRALLEGASAAFFGVILGMAFIEFNVKMGVVYAIVGLAAWIGARVTAKALESIIYRKLGIQPAEDNRNDDNTP